MNDDEPTTAAEMQLMANVDDILARALEAQFYDDCLAMVAALHALQDRHRRGEISEDERRELCFVLDLSISATERLLAHTRELERKERKQQDNG